MLIKTIHAHYRLGDHAQLKYSNNVTTIIFRQQRRELLCTPVDLGECKPQTELHKRRAKFC